MKYSIRHSLFAAFLATIVLSFLMAMKTMMGLMPQMNPIADLVTILQNVLGIPVMLVFAWLLHFFIGTVVWGGLFALLYTKLPGGNAIKGIVLSIGAWVLMMLTVEPLAGHGLFGLQTSPVIPLMSMMLHIVYGAILGTVYGVLSKISDDSA